MSQKIVENAEYVESPIIAKGRLHSGTKCFHAFHSCVVWPYFSIYAHCYITITHSAPLLKKTDSGDSLHSHPLLKWNGLFPCSKSLVGSGVTTGSAAVYLSLFLAHHLGSFLNKIPLY